MRTSFALDDDLLTKLRDLAHRRRVSLRRVVNDTLRAGLSGQRPAARGKRAPVEVATFRSAFRPGVDPLKLNQLSDEIEALAAVERATR